MSHGKPTSAEEMKQKAENKQNNIAKINKKIMVMSGKGGVGKSTVAVNLALSLVKQGLKVGILDIDIHGPSIAKMTNIEGQPITFNENKKPSPIKINDNLYVLTIASIMQSNDDALIWRGALITGVIKQFFEDFEWPELDYLIIDNPPGTGDSPLTLIQTIGKIDGSVIVSTPQDISLLDARKAISFSNKMNLPVLGIVENMSFFSCPHCGEKVEIFAGDGVKKASEDFNIDILGFIPIDTDIAKSGDNGKSYLENFENNLGAKEFNKISTSIINKLK